MDYPSTPSARIDLAELIHPDDAQALETFFADYAGRFGLVLVEAPSAEGADSLRRYLRRHTICEDLTFAELDELVWSGASEILLIEGFAVMSWHQTWTHLETVLERLQAEVKGPCILLVPPQGGKALPLVAPNISKQVGLWLDVDPLKLPETTSGAIDLSEFDSVMWDDLEADEDFGAPELASARSGSAEGHPDHVILNATASADRLAEEVGATPDPDEEFLMFGSDELYGTPNEVVDQPGEAILPPPPAQSGEAVLQPPPAQSAEAVLQPPPEQSDEARPPRKSRPPPERPASWKSTGPLPVVNTPGNVLPTSVVSAPEGGPSSISQRLLVEARQALANGDLEKAEMVLESVQARKEGPEVDAAAFRGLAKLKTMSGDLRKALSLYARALNLVRRSKNARTRGVVLGEIARLRARLGETDAAVELFEDKLKAMRKAGDVAQQATTLGELAAVHLQREEVEKGTAYLRQELEMLQQLDDINARVRAASRAAQICVAHKQLDAAWEFHREHLAALDEAEAIPAIAEALKAFARELGAAGELDDAHAVYEDAIAYFEAADSPSALMAALIDLASLELKQNAPDQAFTRLQWAFAIARQTEDDAARAHIGVRLAQALAATGRKVEAVAVLTRTRQTFEKIGDETSAVRVGHLIDRLNGELEAAASADEAASAAPQAAEAADPE